MSDTSDHRLLAQQFKAAMRRVASTVTIITVCREGELMGTTATAMCSLSANPPSVLVCINHNATLYGALNACRYFCVNILHASQAGVAAVFSDRERRKTGFTDGWKLHPTAPPMLRDCQASILCGRAASYEFGTHTIFIGEVEEVSVREEVSPLVYLNGEYVANE